LLTSSCLKLINTGLILLRGGIMDFEKMLGSMLGGFMGTNPTSGTSATKQSSGTGLMAQLKRGLASPQGMMAAAGIAFGAFEAYQKSQSGNQAGTGTTAPPPLPGMPPAPSASVAPPVPGMPPAPSASVAPPVPGMPPAPSASVAPPVPGMPPVPSASVAPPVPSATPGASDSVRLIQAMIGAAYADGHMDDDERSKIISKVEESGISDEERQWLNNEMDNPRSIAELTAGVNDHRMKTMIYGLSYAAIIEDSSEETAYLNNLAAALGLTAEDTQSLKESF
jgi:uncharacterized membrane protein YebE (DUF533 family)